MVPTSALRFQGSQEEYYTELRYFMTEAADKPNHLLDPDVDRNMPFILWSCFSGLLISVSLERERTRMVREGLRPL
jgi:hypothetical protein